MKKDELTDEIIDLVSGILPYDEVKRINNTITTGQKYSEIIKNIEEECKSGGPVKKEIELRKDLRDAIIELDEVAEIKEITNALFKGVSKNVYRFHKQLIAATITLIIISGIMAKLFIKPRINPDEIYSCYYTPYTNEVSETGREENDLILIAKKNYTEGNFEEAKIFFDNLMNIDKTKPEVLFYAGMTSIELNDYKSAIFNLKNLITDFPKSKWANYGRWYLGLAYLKTRKLDTTKDIFNDIVKNKLCNYKEAEKILKELN